MSPLKPAHHRGIVLRLSGVCLDKGGHAQAIGPIQGDVAFQVAHHGHKTVRRTVFPMHVLKIFHRPRVPVEHLSIERLRRLQIPPVLGVSSRVSADITVHDATASVERQPLLPLGITDRAGIQHSNIQRQLQIRLTLPGAKWGQQFPGPLFTERHTALVTLVQAQTGRTGAIVMLSPCPLVPLQGLGGITALLCGQQLAVLHLGLGLCITGLCQFPQLFTARFGVTAGQQVTGGTGIRRHLTACHQSHQTQG